MLDNWIQSRLDLVLGMGNYEGKNEDKVVIKQDYFCNIVYV